MGEAGNEITRLTASILGQIWGGGGGGGGGGGEVINRARGWREKVKETRGLGVCHDRRVAAPATLAVRSM